VNITPAKLRRLIPASAVALVLAVSYMAPLPAAASKLNNCGVKAGYGYAFHDHGKPCPNRPFPGKGKSSLVGKANGATPNAEAESNAATVSVVDNTTQSLSNGDEQSTGKGHAKSKGHGKGKGHS
jgi:hypothetical protein